jgi:hypothetical protein
MSIEETIRMALREELERHEERVAERVAAKLRDTPSTTSGEDRLISPTEAHRLFGYAPETLRKWAAAKVIRRFGTIRAARYSERELRAHIAKMPTTGTAGTLTQGDIVELARARAERRR